MDAAVRSLQQFLGRRGARIVVSFAALALVTGAIYVLQTVAPVALRESENWVALAVYLVTAVVVSALAAGSS